MTRTRSTFLCWLLLLGSLVAVPAVSPADSARGRARTLFRQGNALFKSKRYDEALKRYTAARALYPSHKIVLNIATTLAALGREAESAGFFELFVQRAASVATPRMLRSARARLGRLRQRLGSVKVVCNVNGAALLVDGQPRGVTPRVAGIYLSPGAHRVVVQKRGYRTFAAEVEAAAGVHRELVVPLEAAPALVATRPAARWPARRGTLLLEDVPQGATVTVDGRLVAGASGPLALKRGVHQVRVAADGYVAWAIAARIAPGRRTTVRVMMKPRRTSSKVGLITCIASGVAALIAGGVGVGFNVHANNQQTTPDYEGARDVAIGAYVTAGVLGATALVFGGLHYYVRGRAKRREAPRAAAAVVPLQGGATVTGLLRF